MAICWKMRAYENGDPDCLWLKLSWSFQANVAQIKMVTVAARSNRRIIHFCEGLDGRRTGCFCDAEACCEKNEKVATVVRNALQTATGVEMWTVSRWRTAIDLEMYLASNKQPLFITWENFAEKTWGPKKTPSSHANRFPRSMKASSTWQKITAHWKH